jgi:hypothetical protein
VPDYCEHVIEPASSIRRGAFLAQRRGYSLFKGDFVTRSCHVNQVLNKGCGSERDFYSFVLKSVEYD